MIPSMLHGLNVSCNHFRIALVDARSNLAYLYEHVKLKIFKSLPISHTPFVFVPGVKDMLLSSKINQNRMKKQKLETCYIQFIDF